MDLETLINKLNFNLKFEIINFLPFKQIYETIFLLNKSFFQAFKTKRKSIQKMAEIKNEEIISKISFKDEDTNKIIEIFENTKESEFFLIQIYAYFLFKKYETKEYLAFYFEDKAINIEVFFIFFG